MPAGTDTLPQIEHIVVLMMENHSYDDHFGMLKRGDGFKLGADGLPLDANLYTDGKLLKAFHMPSTCQLDGQPEPELEREPHRVQQRPQRRVREGQRPGRDGLLGRAPTSPSTTGSARRSRVADRWFCSVLAQTYPNRRFLVAGTAAGIISTTTDALLAPDAAERHDLRAARTRTASRGATTTPTCRPRSA